VGESVGGWVYDSEFLELLRQIVDCIDGGRLDKLGGLLARVRRLRRRGVNVDFNMSVIVLEAFTNAVSNYIEEDKYNDVLLMMGDLSEFLEIFNMSVWEERIYCISDAFLRRISECIRSGEYDDAEEWIETFRQFLVF
jgi:hypothetical protein